MPLKTIPLKALAVHRANDRHGDLVDEDAAIEWLLTKRAQHMRNLTKDIVKAGTVYEPPLVHEMSGQYTVYDGNRRVTSLKLLDNPQKAPTKDWSDFFQDQRDQWQGQIPAGVECQVETDLERIDEILFRRHTGGQGGVGQSQWDAEAKTNFQRRTGKHTRANVAEEIETLLKNAGLLKDGGKKLPRSNLNRLLSAEGFRNRVGISVEKNHVKITHDDQKVLSVLSRIANDLIAGTVTLESVWSNDGKKAYLDKLEKEGLLPNAYDALPKPQNIKAVDAKKSPTVTTTPAKTKLGERKTLIRNIDYGVTPNAKTQRANDIWHELQFQLKFGQHDNAIAVLFRALLEFSISHYIDAKGLTTVNPNDKLRNRFEKALDHMVAQQSFTKEQAGKLKKFMQKDPIVSSATLNAYVHDPNFFPSDLHLKSMWDTLSDFIVTCLNA